MLKFSLTDKTYIRYTEQGSGPPLLILHTLRNRLEYADRILPSLCKFFKVYVLDLPGHGDSPINKNTNYDLSFIANSIIDFIDFKNLNELTIVGESIGAVLSAIIAKKIPQKVKKIFCFNPYDYDKKFGEGVSRGNIISKFLFFHMRLPFGIGYLFSKLESYIIVKIIFHGGVRDKNSITTNYIRLLCKSLKKNYFTYHERNLFFNSILLDHKEIYNDLKTKVSLNYGEYDWSKINERKKTMFSLGLNSYNTLGNTGHFSFLESPSEVSNIIIKNFR